MKKPIKIVIGKRNNVLKNIEHELVYAGNEYGKLIALESFINEGKYHTPVLIFVQSKHRALDLEREMVRLPIKAKAIHSGMDTK